jgi:hypothetical protein
MTELRTIELFPKRENLIPQRIRKYELPMPVIMPLIIGRISARLVPAVGMAKRYVPSENNTAVIIANLRRAKTLAIFWSSRPYIKSKILKVTIDVNKCIESALKNGTCVTTSLKYAILLSKKTE